ncbi:hypothetical protein HMPREF3195_00088 [Peptostreptococcus anaerobius]|uniref:Uncharacterized protein n=1 Tax=Peptostreptococcus anaerobius TaxID=1261 RepID=A0A135YZB4_9FIRM|nr:hypothetical protein HMPREF3195_00088 [Peptostreptococcus anaerobius]
MKKPKAGLESQNQSLMNQVMNQVIRQSVNRVKASAFDSSLPLGL